MNIIFTWGQVKDLAAAMGLADTDPPPTPASITAFVEAARVVDDEAAVIELFGLGDDD